MLKVSPLKPEPEVIEEAVRVLKNGGLVAFPTETVYGLGARVFDRVAVKRIFEVKGRPPDNPLIVHVSGLKMLKDVVTEVPTYLRKVLEKVWPGPITFVLKKRPEVPREVTAGLNTVAVRCPAHPVALALIDSLGEPVAAPSANLSGRPSPTRPEHVIEDLGGKIELILDAGETFFGVESTVINVLADPPVLLRPGPFTVEELSKLLGRKVIIPPQARGFKEGEGPALSPGVKYRHYSPKKPLILVELSGLKSLGDYVECVKTVARKVVREGRNVVLLVSEETSDYYGDLPKVVLGSRENLYSVAKNLFKALRAADRVEGDVIVSEGFEEVGVGLAVMNRLRKASVKIIRCSEPFGEFTSGGLR